MKLTIQFIAVAVLTCLTLGNVYAVEARVRCEKRDDRSKISADFKNVTLGKYKVGVESGKYRATTELINNTGDEVETDFDSDAGNVADGAVKISPNFIMDGEVTASLIKEGGETVVSITKTCKNK